MKIPDKLPTTLILGGQLCGGTPPSACPTHLWGNHENHCAPPTLQYSKSHQTFGDLHLLICRFKMTFGFSPGETSCCSDTPEIHPHFPCLSKYVQIRIYLNRENRLPSLSHLDFFPLLFLCICGKNSNTTERLLFFSSSLLPFFPSSLLLRAPRS